MSDGRGAQRTSRLGRVVAFLTDPVIERLERRRQYAYVLMPLLLAAAFATLILLNVLVRSLGGELVYGVVVTTIALWALAQTAPVRRLLSSWEDPGFSIRRALVWALFAVFALPVAFFHRPVGLIVLLAIPVAWALYRLVRQIVGRPRTKREPWIPVAIGIAFLGIFLWQFEVADEEEPSSAAPPAPVAESTDDARLARLVRPILLFDRGESRAPLDIDDAIAGRRIQNCEDGECGEAIEDAANIDLGADHLAIEDVTGVRGGGGGSAYYYHLVAKEERIYVDYWWYFTRNPSPVGASVGCGPAARWVGLTCHDHPSDWEGVTVVLGRCEGESQVCVPRRGEMWAPIAVRYAEHEHVVSYAWTTLRELWRSDPRRQVARPLVFVARDSHASYAEPCPSGCKQHARYPWRTKRDEAPRDGQLNWKWNGEGCEPEAAGTRAARREPDCLLPMPITDQGLAASWNAYPGRWGSQTCILDGAYCDTSKAPRSPSRQSRYRDPGEPGPWICVKDRRPSAPAPSLRTCADEADPDEEIPS